MAEALAGLDTFTGARYSEVDSRTVGWYEDRTEVIEGVEHGDSTDQEEVSDHSASVNS